jgi:hypothetical protein
LTYEKKGKKGEERRTTAHPPAAAGPTRKEREEGGEEEEFNCLPWLAGRVAGPLLAARALLLAALRC